jgi:mannitol/fructose-specific phosphotransferase system IIA component (Ntr-type)
MLKIVDYLQTGNIFLDTALESKTDVLKYVADVCVQNGMVKNFSALYEGLIQREQTMSTGVGGGIGFPHATSPEAGDAAVVLIRLAKPIDFDSLDHLPVDIILALIIPESNPAIHVRLLARVSRLCRQPEFLAAIRQADDAKRLFEQIKLIEENMTFY